MMSSHKQLTPTAGEKKKTNEGAGKVAGIENVHRGTRSQVALFPRRDPESRESPVGGLQVQQTRAEQSDSPRRLPAKSRRAFARVEGAK